MKTIKSIAALFVAASLLVGVVPTPARADVDVSFGFFYDSLTPHGSWYVSAQYGRVWQPSVYVNDWNPYYDGHWEYTDFGWTWVSDYHWGAVPYHYGTWVRDARYGWVWVPGYTWAPAWVVFRTGHDYCGWAPVPPGYSVGASFHVDPSFFVFVSNRDFLAPRVRHAVIPRSQTTVVIKNTKIINNITVQNNIVVNRGPDVKVVERASGRRIERKPIERVTRVAPFERVSKERLRVAPDKASKKVRAAEPMSADRPLPDRAQQPRAQSKQDQQDRPKADRSAAEKKREADQAKARADADRRAAEQRARTQSQASATAKQRSERPQQQKATAQETKARADASARAKAEADTRAKAQAQAQAKAKAQAEAKRKAEAKKKKPEPEKNEQRNDSDKN